MRTRAVEMFLIACLAAACVDAADAPAPMRHFRSLVAGSYAPGYRDGKFSRAAFNEPSGILYDQTHDRLVVADTANHVIRLVDMVNANQVSTLELGETGARKGSQVFLKPVLLDWLEPGATFLVYDGGKHDIALAGFEGAPVRWILDGKESADLKPLFDKDDLADMSYSPEFKKLFCVFKAKPGILALDLDARSGPLFLEPAIAGESGAYAGVLAKGKNIYALKSAPGVTTLWALKTKDGGDIALDPSLQAQAVGITPAAKVAVSMQKQADKFTRIKCFACHT